MLAASLEYFKFYSLKCLQLLHKRKQFWLNFLGSDWVSLELGYPLTLLSLVYTIKDSVITVGILHGIILSFEGFVRNV